MERYSTYQELSVSAAQAELGALLLNMKAAVSIRQTLVELGHKQQLMPFQTDNSTTNCVVMNKIQPEATKVTEMQFCWLRDHKAKNHFCFYWCPGTRN